MLGRPFATGVVPPAAVGQRVPQTVEFPVARGLEARFLVPRAAVLVGVPHALQVAVDGGVVGD